MSNGELLQKLLESINLKSLHDIGDDVARLQIHANKVLDAHLIPGFEVDAREMDDGVDVRMRVLEGVHLAKPVHVCFGLLPETGIQNIKMDVKVEANASASILAHCTFPNAKDVLHVMDAEIDIAPGATYSYFERHVHGEFGGVTVRPKARITLGENARFRTEFELIKGRVGEIDMGYDVECASNSILEMVARISGRADDKIKIHEGGHLKGEYARAVLKSYIAVRDDARAEVYNMLRADGGHARGHVDCKEIVQGRGSAKAVPIVEVNNPTAHITHEAAIGSVDSKQLQTLQSRGLTEDEAVELIIQGLLS
jgi:Fe-S cluster assembly scaffold protein SufB